MKNKKEIIKAIRLTLLSFESHLDDSINKKLTGKVVGDKKFHLSCLKEYNEIIRVLINQL